jgi:hypothetical protein
MELLYLLSSRNTLTLLWTGRPRNRDKVSAYGSRFCPFDSIQTDAEAHTPPYPVCDRTLPPECEVARGGSKSDHSPLIAKVKECVEPCVHCPYISMGAKRKYEGIFSFYVHKIKLKETSALNLVNQGKVRNKK